MTRRVGMHSEITRAVMRSNVEDIERAVRYAEHRTGFVRRPGRAVAAAFRLIGDTAAARAVVAALGQHARTHLAHLDQTSQADAVTGPYAFQVSLDSSAD